MGSGKLIEKGVYRVYMELCSKIKKALMYLKVIDTCSVRNRTIVICLELQRGQEI